MTTTEEALREALEPPSDYYGSMTDLVTQGWARVFGRHRDSDILTISNFETILREFSENYELNDDYRVEGSSHWLVGWSDTLMVRALDCECEDWEKADFHYVPIASTGKWWVCTTCGVEANVMPIFERSLEIAEALQDYPVLDESDYSRREYEDCCETLVNCYNVPEDKVEECYDWLFDNYSVSSADDVTSQMLDEWMVLNEPKS